jgi:hypothetical protein
LCPELSSMEDGAVKNYWRYFEPSNKCFKTSRRGPCGVNMVFYVQEAGSIYGDCDCKPDTVNQNRMMIFDNETNACYPIFTQVYLDYYLVLVHAVQTLFICSL